MPICPKCEARGVHSVIVAASDGKFHCVKCDYVRTIPVHVPTQAELLLEIENLKREIISLKKELRN